MASVLFKVLGVNEITRFLLDQFDRFVLSRRIVPANGEFPCLLLPPVGSSGTNLRLYSMTNRKDITFDMPAEAEADGWFCWASSRGWVLIATGYRNLHANDYNPKVFLFNPVSGVKLRLPPLPRFFKEFMDRAHLAWKDISSFMRKMDVMYDDRGDLVLAVLFIRVKKTTTTTGEPAGDEYDNMSVEEVPAVCKPSIDVEWTTFDEGAPSPRQQGYSDLLFYKGSLYLSAISKDFKNPWVYRRTITLPDNSRVRLEILDSIEFVDVSHPEHANRVYLVESVDGELLQVVQEIVYDDDDDDDDDNDYDIDEDEDEFFYPRRTKGFSVFKMGSKGWLWEEVTSLGNQAIFVSQASSSCSMGVFGKRAEGEDDDQSFIYFTTSSANNLTCHECGVFNVKTQRIDQLLLPGVPERWPIRSPVCWFTPNYDI